MPRWADVEVISAQGPGQNVALAPERASAMQIAENLAALANAEGGTLIVTRSGRPHLRPGLLDAPVALQRAVEAILLCEPRLVMSLPQVVTETGADSSVQSAVVVLQVPAGPLCQSTLPLQEPHVVCGATRMLPLRSIGQIA
jgi:hypothetical protein